MKRLFFAALLTLCCVAPALASYNIGAPVCVPVDNFGWGLVFSPMEGASGSPVMLWVIPGGAYAGSVAANRAAEVRRRFAGHHASMRDGAAVGQIYAARNVGSDDWSVILEGFANGKWVQTELITVDRRTSSPYGAAPRELAQFWAMRLKALTMAGTSGCPAAWQSALVANWRDWRSSTAWYGSFDPGYANK